jgi:hypothetical protein
MRSVRRNAWADAEMVSDEALRRGTTSISRLASTWQHSAVSGMICGRSCGPVNSGEFHE